MKKEKFINIKVGKDIKTIPYREYREDIHVPANGIVFEQYPAKPKEEPKEECEEECEKEEAKEELADDEDEEDLLLEGFPCEECGKICKSELGLKSHLRSHN